MKESDLAQKIQHFTEETGGMPQYICGRFDHLQEAMGWDNAFQKLPGFWAYNTVFGPIYFELDHAAEKPYLR
jgi:hypothetical protein